MHGAVIRLNEFRFQTGSIKRVRTRLSIGLCLKFRFQTGSIKRENWMGVSALTDMFRFQTGSIKSRGTTRQRSDCE